MEIECIYTLTNDRFRLQFLAMERSLRSTGCDLPLKVLPYNSQTFDLPAGSEWVYPRTTEWVSQNQADRICSKYHCLTQRNYCYTDVDIIFLKDPREALRGLSGFVVADTEWSKPHWTYSPESGDYLVRRSSLWLQRVFNGGFFASDFPLFSEDRLLEILATPSPLQPSLLRNDQVGLNLLAAMANTIPVNLNLPPSVMESTWAGDYPGEFRPLWSSPERLPIFIHWAGPVLDDPRPINSLFEEFLTTEEKQIWRTEQTERLARIQQKGRWPLGARILNRILGILYPNYYVQPRSISSLGEIITR